MEKALVVAKTFYNEYYNRFWEKMDEMKMHKLMYFVQRESLMFNKELLFKEDFYGWKFGPVLKSVRSEYMSGTPFDKVEGDASLAAKQMVRQVMDRYAAMTSWRLSRLSHNEFSWKRSRNGLDASDNGDVKLDVNAMKVDAARELSQR